MAAACHQAPDLIDAALADFDFRRATAAIWSIVEEANRYIEHIRPWHLAKAAREGDTQAAGDLDATLAVLVRACNALAGQLAPFLPNAAARISAQCTPSAGRLPAPQPLFPKI